MHGTTQSVGISSVPSGAKVIVSGQSFGTTPAFAELSRKDKHIVSISMPGYVNQELTLINTVSGWVWGNIVFGGLVGLAVDAISGGLYRLTPDQVIASLDESPKTGHNNLKDGIHIQFVLAPDSGWQEIGKLESIDNKLVFSDFK